MAPILLLTACAAPPTRPAPPPQAAMPAPTPPVAGQQAAATAPPAPPPTRDYCGADQLQWLVGRPRVEIPVPLEPARRRVLCATCPISPEVNVWRQTILYDPRNDTVMSVNCR
jgi:hypothetical protein